MSEAVISLLVAVRNEGERMQAFLARHAEYFDDVVVVHDGKCTDDTLDIAVQFPNVCYYERPGRHNPFPHREWALHNVIPHGNWVAVFDPDESLSDELLLELRDKLVSAADSVNADAIVVTQRCLVDDVEAWSVPVWRIFKNTGEVHYPEHPHAGPEGLTKAVSYPEYVYEHRNSSIAYPSKVRRRNAHYRRIIAADPNSSRRVAWEKGMEMYPKVQAILDAAGVSLEVLDRPLRRLGDEMCDRLSDELGIETAEELAEGDTEYIASVLDVSESSVRKMQSYARRQLG